MRHSKSDSWRHHVVVTGIETRLPRSHEGGGLRCVSGFSSAGAVRLSCRPETIASHHLGVGHCHDRVDVAGCGEADRDDAVPEGTPAVGRLRAVHDRQRRVAVVDGDGRDRSRTSWGGGAEDDGRVKLVVRCPLQVGPTRDSGLDGRRAAAVDVEALRAGVGARALPRDRHGHVGRSRCGRGESELPGERELRAPLRTGEREDDAARVEGSSARRVRGGGDSHGNDGRSPGRGADHGAARKR